MALVSVIIPTKNRGEVLRETIASLSAQTFQKWEAIVVDDGSTDGTEEMVQAICSEDRRVRFVRRDRSPSGASACRNIGVSSARGDYVLFLDSDDLLGPMCLERRIEVLDANPHVDFVVSLTGVFRTTPNDTPYLWNVFTAEDDLDRFLRLDQPWQTSGPLWRRANLLEVGPWDERALSGQDWEFHVRALAAGLNYVKVNEIDSFWRSTTRGSIGASWAGNRHVCNRVRLFKRVISVLRDRKALTKRRRRILMGLFYEHAFRLRQNRRIGLRIWALGRRLGISGTFQFATALALEGILLVARRILFPEWHLARTHTRARSSAVLYRAGREERDAYGVFTTAGSGRPL